MKKIYLFFFACFLFLNATIALGKSVSYSSFFIDRSSPDYFLYFGPWSVTFADACKTSYSDYTRDENIASLLSTPSTFGATIGASSSMNYSDIYIRTRKEKWEKATVIGPGCYAAPHPTYGVYPTYTNLRAPLAYYGFKTTVNGLLYYGWLKVENGEVYAYIEDIPGFSIKVGDTIGFQTYPSDFVKLSGIAYRESNSDGMYNVGDAPLPYQSISLEGTVYSTSTGSDGSYTMMVPGNLLSGSKKLHLALKRGDVYNTPVNGIMLLNFPIYSNINNLNFGVNYDPVIEAYPNINVSLQSNPHRRCFKSSLNILVQNKSSQVLRDIPLLLEIPAYVEVLNSTPSYQSLRFKVASYTIPYLAAHGSYNIALIDSIICGVESIRGQSQCYRVSINIPFEGSDIFPYYECQDSMHLFKLVNRGNSVMSDSANYKVFSNNIMQGTYKYKTNGVDTFYIGIPNDGRSIRIEVLQEVTNTRMNMRYSIAEGCGTINILPQNIGLADVNSSSDNDYYSATSCFTIRDSYDPNELIASPTGWGTEHKIVKEQLITYHIGFQNTGSADAVSIVLVDTLSSLLDLSTFKILRSTHAFTSEITPTPDGRYRLAVKYAGINLPPSSVNETGSHGYIEFSILPKSTTAIGTQIKNQAFIYFDFNSYIATNSVLQTIALPEVVSNPVHVRISGGEFDVDNQTLTYGDGPVTPSLTTNAGTAGLSATSLSPDVVTFDSGKLVIHKSGTATLKYKHSGNTKYLPIAGTEERTVTVTVSKAPLAVQPISAQRFVGESNPVLEWVATGFVYNEDESVLQGNPEISCTADATSAIAEYPITVSAGTLSAENYDITYTAGTLKVVQVTGIQDWSASGIRVYPIPSKGGMFTVDVPYEKLDHIILTDMLGRSEVYEQGQINSQLQGMVLIKIFTDKGIYNGKVELTR